MNPEEILKSKNDTIYAIDILPRCSIKEFFEYIKNKENEEFTLHLNNEYYRAIVIDSIEVNDDINNENIKWVKIRYLPIIKIRY